MKLKRASLKDARLYWEWVNDKIVRENSIKRQFIEWDNHYLWFKKKIKDKKCYMFLLDYDNKSIGQVRFEEIKGYNKIDYSIVKCMRKRRLSKIMLSSAIERIRKHNNNAMIAEVLPSNIISSKVFDSLGFQCKIVNNILLYTKKPM